MRFALTLILSFLSLNTLCAQTDLSEGQKAAQAAAAAGL